MSKHEAPSITHATDTSFPREHMGHEQSASASFESGMEDEEDLPTLPKRAVWRPDGTVVLKLRTPVVQTTQVPGSDLSEQNVSELIFYPLTGAAMLRIQSAKNDGQRAMSMMKESTRMGGFTGDEIFKRMDARDFVASTVIAAIFTNPGL